MDTDRELMKKVAARDERAFAHLVEKYGGRLLAVALRLLGSRPDAEDAVQLAFLRCYNGAGSYRPEWAVSTWLYRIVTNVCVDEMRRRAARERLNESIASVVPPGGASGAPDGLLGAARGGREIDLRRAWPRVPREARLLLALRYVDGLSYKELARIRGITVNTVKSQLARGKSILRAAIDEGIASAQPTGRFQGARR